MSDRMIFGQFYDTNSWLHRLDPRTKIISLFLFMIGIIFIKNIYLLLIVFGLIVILVLSTKIPFTRFLKSLKMMIALFIFTALFQIIFNDVGNKLITFYFSMTYLSLGISVLLLAFFFISKKFIKKQRFLLFLLLLIISMYIQSKITITPVLFNYEINVFDKGLISASFIIVRIVSLIFISSLLTLSTRPTDLNNGLESVLKPLEKIGIKTSIVAMMTSIALRFIPTLINEAERILKAQASRGVDFKEGRLSEKVIQIISLLIPMLFVAIKRAEDLANAMEARGYIPGEERTKLYELKYRFTDYLTIAVSISFIIFGIISRGYFASTM